MRRLPAFSFAVAGVMAVQGCASQWAAKSSVSDVQPVVLKDGRLQVQVRPCVDRTGSTSRDLGREATDALTAKLKSAAEFELIDNGRYILNCDVSGFIEGSAFKRWLMPGWGATSAQVAVMVTDGTTGETVGIARGNAEVAAGGLYTVGANKVILGAALDDVIRQLRQVAAGSTLQR